jgi:hypothetical protein
MAMAVTMERKALVLQASCGDFGLLAGFPFHGAAAVSVDDCLDMAD